MVCCAFDMLQFDVNNAQNINALNLYIYRTGLSNNVWQPAHTFLLGDADRIFFYFILIQRKCKQQYEMLLPTKGENERHQRCAHIFSYANILFQLQINN